MPFLAYLTQKTSPAYCKPLKLQCCDDMSSNETKTNHKINTHSAHGSRMLKLKVHVALHILRDRVIATQQPIDVNNDMYCSHRLYARTTYTTSKLRVETSRASNVLIREFSVPWPPRIFFNYFLILHISSLPLNPYIFISLFSLFSAFFFCFPLSMSFYL